MGSFSYHTLSKRRLSLVARLKAQAKKRALLQKAISILGALVWLVCTATLLDMVISHFTWMRLMLVVVLPLSSSILLVQFFAEPTEFWPRIARGLRVIFSMQFFPTLWLLLGLLFDKKLRERVYRPCVEELTVDLFTARATDLWQNKWARLWILFCLTIRTLFLVFGCLRLSFFAPFAKLIPTKWRSWWNLFS